jgi:hypothetical protein
LALARFVDRYEFDPTCRPVILVVMCQNLPLLLISAVIAGCADPGMPTMDSVDVRIDQVPRLESPGDVERALANAINSDRAVVFLHLDWAIMKPQRALYLRCIDEYSQRFPEDDVRFHYIDCTPITHDYTPLTSLPGWPGSGDNIYTNGTGGWGDVVWIEHGVVRHVEAMYESKSAADFIARTRRFLALE